LTKFGTARIWPNATEAVLLDLIFLADQLQLGRGRQQHARSVS